MSSVAQKVATDTADDGREQLITAAETDPDLARLVGAWPKLSIKADSFSAALAMIASLPLSDAEKADAVRRLMSELSDSHGLPNRER